MTSSMQNALAEVLTGGNHLGSVLIGRLGPSFPVYRTPLEVVHQKLSGDDWDIRLAWRSIMRLRDTLEKL